MYLLYVDILDKKNISVNKRGNVNKALSYQTDRLGKITMHNFSYFINKVLIFYLVIELNILIKICHPVIQSLAP